MSETQLDLFSGAAASARPTLVFDLETQKSFAEVGGRDRFRDLKVSVAVTQELPSRAFRTYFEWDLPRLVDDLFEAGLVVGFNVKRFDYEVLSAYTDRDLSALPTLDILEAFEKAQGFRVKLDALAAASLGRRKTADGLAAIRWFKEGRLEEIAAYCREDVAITADLYLYGKERGCLLFPDRSGRIQSCRVSW